MFLTGGVVGDVLLIWLRPSPDRVVAQRVFAACLPPTTYALYFGYLLATSDIMWPEHVWLGSDRAGRAGRAGRAARQPARRATRRPGRAG